MRNSPPQSRRAFPKGSALRDPKMREAAKQRGLEPRGLVTTQLGVAREVRGGP